jgi:hypothetical protein
MRLKRRFEKDKRMAMSMYRKLLGYQGADKKQPIYEAMPGALVTRAFIHCSPCGDAISPSMGPRSNAYCIECTDVKIESDAKAKADEEKEKEKLAKIKVALEKQKELDDAKRRDDDDTDLTKLTKL